jgi:hypothetical protein
MKIIRRRSQVIIETHELTIVRLNGNHEQLVCGVCGCGIEPLDLTKGPKDSETTDHGHLSDVGSEIRMNINETVSEDVPSIFIDH